MDDRFEQWWNHIMRGKEIHPLNHAAIKKFAKAAFTARRMEAFVSIAETIKAEMRIGDAKQSQSQG